MGRLGPRLSDDHFGRSLSGAPSSSSFPRTRESSVLPRSGRKSLDVRLRRSKAEPAFAGMTAFGVISAHVAPIPVKTPPGPRPRNA
ncbi:hypothetical protein [Lysobacter gummosus]|uniref:hypothetical protein n=1 Tax=Lysobacter gummosus TaxID=262324 RepID=UPI0036375A21